MNYIQLKQGLQRENNKNFTIVKCRKSHTCSHCGNTIENSSECLTVNAKNNGRKWYCKSCVAIMLEIKNAQEIFNNTAFDDEGAALANLENIDLAVSEFESLRR
jgi:transcription elongation factor Elf1